MLPIVALVGRPNVGKSTLFNRLAGKNLAIVHDQPGVTRDRHYADTAILGREITIIDTGGFDPTDEDPMRQGIARHVQAAIEQADVIVCVLDALGQPTEADRQAVELLRRSSKPVIYLGNRADNEKAELEAADLHRLGIEPLLCGSALHGRRMAQLQTAIVERLPKEEATEEEDESCPRIALLGRPNAGKSSLLNRLSGEERSLVDDRPGTTRDPIDARIEYKKKPYVIVDTAGVRKRSKVREDIELASVMRSLRCISRAQVIVLMCDATRGVEDQDAKLLSLAEARGRAIIVVLNKTDLMSKDQVKQAMKDAADTLHFAPWVPMLAVSAKTGHGVAKLMERIDKCHQEFTRRVSTSTLNKFFEEVLDHHPPPTKGGKAPRLYYVTQAQSAPPVFIAMSSAPDSIDESYHRFVVNQLRSAFGFESVPVRLKFRARRRRGEEPPTRA